MDILTGLLIICGMYAVLFFFDTFFRSCSMYPYIQFLKGTGLEINFLNIKWSTLAFNRCIVRWGSSRGKFFNLWFTVGLYISLILIPVSITILLVAFVQNFMHKSAGGGILEPLVPGVNLPATEIAYYALALILCSVIHELGHALAAVKEDVHLIGTGATIFFILPIAFVDLSKDNLVLLENWKKLKIFTAGVWHNLVLTLVAYLMILSVPFVFSGVFYYSNGVTVYGAAKNSPLIGAKGLKIGDTLTKINHCVVSDKKAYYNCLGTLSDSAGFCFDYAYAENYDESVVLKELANGQIDCCDGAKTENLCFEYLDKGEILEIQPHLCLPARKMLEKSKFFCHDSYACPKPLHCFKALLSNGTNLFKIQRISKADVIYIGNNLDFVNTLKISSFIPKNTLFKTVFFPEAVIKFLEYVEVFSFSFALLNIIPCMFMDGQFIFDTLLLIFCRKHIDKEGIKILSTLICIIFTVILMLHCFLTGWSLFLNY